MFTCTEKAVAAMKEILEGWGSSAKGVRIFLMGAGCSGPRFGMELQTDEPFETDRKQAVEGMNIFFDALCEKYLEGFVIDYKATPEESGFVFTNSASPGGCGSGCGSGGCGCG
ncbi:MAG: iron-sulfur cluster assembly accessory protein [bacterium]|nr:iron-sulfur cluster assembly accessory protein [bacterium]